LLSTNSDSNGIYWGDINVSEARTALERSSLGMRQVTAGVLARALLQHLQRVLFQHGRSLKKSKLKNDGIVGVQEKMDMLLWLIWAVPFVM